MVLADPREECVVDVLHEVEHKNETGLLEHTLVEVVGQNERARPMMHREDHVEQVPVGQVEPQQPGKMVAALVVGKPSAIDPEVLVFLPPVPATTPCSSGPPDLAGPR